MGCCWQSLDLPLSPATVVAFQGSDDEDEGQKVPPPPDTPMPPPLPPTPDQVIVRKDYDPKGMSCLPAFPPLCFSSGFK